MVGANWPDEPMIGSLFRLIWHPGVMLRAVLARLWLRTNRGRAGCQLERLVRPPPRLRNLLEDLFAGAGRSLDTTDHLENMAQVRGIALHRSTASAST